MSTGSTLRFAALLGAVVVLGAVALSASPAFAAKNAAGGGKHGGGGSSGTGTCSVTPNPATLGGLYTVSGSGYSASEVLNVDVVDSAGMQVLLTSADSSGNFHVSSYASYTGSYAVSVYDKTTLKAKCGFTVN